MKVKKAVLLIAGTAIIFFAVYLFLQLFRLVLGPARPCTEIGCSDKYVLALRSADGQFAEGRYEVYLTPEGKATKSCFFVISNDMQECASGHCVSEENCNATYSLGNNIHEHIDISYPVMETTLSIVVKRDNVTIIEETLEPVYHTIQPNGRGCMPICTQGKNVLIVK